MAIEARIRELGSRHETLERAIQDETSRPAGDALRRIVRLGDRHQGSEDQQDQAERSHGFIVRVADAGACRFGNFAFHSHP